MYGGDGRRMVKVLQTTVHSNTPLPEVNHYLCVSGDRVSRDTLFVCGMKKRFFNGNLIEKRRKKERKKEREKVI